MFTVANPDYPNHPVLARALHAYLRWRNVNNRHQRWGRRPETQAA
jgi:hypothetical protein